MGTFGPDCNSRCHCLNQSSCNTIDGACPEAGCEIGWGGKACDTSEFNNAPFIAIIQMSVWSWPLVFFPVSCAFFLLFQDLIRLYRDRVKRIWYLSPMRAAKAQASLRIRAVSPEPSLLAHTSSESRGTFRQKARSLAPLNGWACAVKTCHDTNSLDGAHRMGVHDCDH